MPMLANDFHHDHHGNDGTTAVRCRRCRTTGGLRPVRGTEAFECRDRDRCAERVRDRVAMRLYVGEGL